ncbi:hypothetical protein [Candidatus Laterigemmans baculatus]|uniref:hypothetical protein n=1 Tax=Candidatus Laterigemmans baculatus TaxID=2770505 RepID=UPI0013DAE9F2|nr:hypothetical protein [Candidatus Laterigemmans baculatus]
MRQLLPFSRSKTGDRGLGRVEPIRKHEHLGRLRKLRAGRDAFEQPLAGRVDRVLAAQLDEQPVRSATGRPAAEPISMHRDSRGNAQNRHDRKHRVRCGRTPLRGGGKRPPSVQRLPLLQQRSQPDVHLERHRFTRHHSGCLR